MADPRASQRYFEDVRLGDEFEEWQQPTPEHVAAFVGTMRVPGSADEPGGGRFTDPEAARRSGLERPLVPGPMSTAMITRLVTDWMGPLGRIVSLDVSFRRPVLHGDRVRCVALVTAAGDEALEAVAPGIVSLEVSLEREGGEQPVQGTALVELPRRA